MTHKFWIGDGGGPVTGLSPTWEYLLAIDSTDKSGSAPAITEIGGGWYKFSLTYGTAPWDVNELVGVIDAGSEIIDAQRYIPISISLRDLGMYYLSNTRQQTTAGGLIEVLDDDGSTVVFTFTPSTAGGKEILTVGTP